MDKRVVATLAALAVVSLCLAWPAKVAVPQPLHAAQAIYYVSPQGNDYSGQGTEGNPWQTISYAVSKASAGDTIKLMDDDNEATDDYVENVVLEKSLTIERYSHDGPNPQVGAPALGIEVFLVSADNVTLRGLDISGEAGGAIHLSMCRGCVVQGNRTGWDRNCSATGVRVTGGGGHQIRDNMLSYFAAMSVMVDHSDSNVICNNVISNSFSAGMPAVFLQSSEFNTFAGNTISGNICTGIITGGGAWDNEFYLNRFEDNTGGDINTGGEPNFWHSRYRMIYTYKGATFTGYLGNYYGDYVGVDDGSGGRTQGDGVGDTQLPHSAYGAHDSYPLVDSTAGAYQVLDELITVPAPKAGFRASVTRGVAPLTTAFRDDSTGENITSWQWDFGDGQTSTEQNPAHSYESAGAYTVSLTVTNSGGSRSIARQNHIQVIDALVWETVPRSTDTVIQTPEGTITLVIPAGAVIDNASIIIRRLPKDGAPPAGSGYVFGDTCFSVQGMEHLARNVTMHIRYSDADLAAADADPSRLILSYYDESISEWITVDTKVDTSAETLSTETGHLSRWAVMRKESEPGTSAGLPFWGWGLAGVGGVAILAALSLAGYRMGKRRARHV